MGKISSKCGKRNSKKRPAVVISSNAYNQTTGFIQVYGYVNAMQIKEIDFMAEERHVSFIEKLTGAELGMVAQIVKAIFNFDDLLGI